MNCRTSDNKTGNIAFWIDNHSFNKIYKHFKTEGLDVTTKQKRK